MSNIIDKIQVSGVTYDIQGSGGGGKAIEAGRGISITTGETADTVSFNLPISAGTGTNSIIEGSNTSANGTNSHAEGNRTTASGSTTHAEGSNTSANGYASHAEGSITTANGSTTHAEGGYTTANGISSHAEGDSTLANGDFSHAEGSNTIANNQSEHASGQFNVSNSASTTFGNSGNTLFSVGNGTADNARHNAFEIRQNGDIYLSSGGTDIKLQDHLGGGGSSYTAGDGIDITNNVISVTGKVDTSTYNTYTAATDTALASKADTATTYTKTETDNLVTAATSTKQDTLVSGTNIKTINNESLLGSGNIDIQGSGNPTVELTQAEYDALVTAGTVSADTYYIITDAQAGDLTNYYTKGETNTLLGGKADTATTYTKTEVDTALASKQTTLTAGTGISIIDNVISATGGGGGKAISGGTNISITTGETADTISCTLQIKSGSHSSALIFGDMYNSRATATNSVAFGNATTAETLYGFACGNHTKVTSQCAFAEGNYTVGNGYYSHAEGNYTSAMTSCSHAEGSYTKTSNDSEHASGQYNVSNKETTTFGNSGNTLFSVGNGTADNARHNAFEIRQDGSIYLNDGTNDVKLQDTIIATAANTTALGGLSLVKLTQAQYDALATKDNSTLYVIVN